MDCCVTVIEKWIVIPIWTAPMGVSKINSKLPANIEQIIGLAFTQSEYEGEFTQQRIGEISLLCNNRLTHPLNFDIQKRTKNQRIDTIELNLEEPICGGTRLSGYYRSFTEKQHLLNLYVHCIVKN